MKKICCKCKKEKDIKKFDKTKTGIKGHCKECRKLYVNDHYKNNKDYYVEKAAHSNKKAKSKCDEYIESLNCHGCDLSFKGIPYVCDFHHKDDNKLKNPSRLKTGSFSSFIKEVEKCRPLCANCHRKVHNDPIFTLRSMEGQNATDVQTDKGSTPPE